MDGRTTEKSVMPSAPLMRPSVSAELKNGTIGFLDLKNMDLDTKIAILNDLVQKLWSKTYFYF